MIDKEQRKLFGKRIKMQRKKMGYKNQECFATAMNVSLKTVRNWEQGVVLPEIETILDICGVLKCDIDFLFGRIDFSIHEIKLIHEITGLSENAIIWLKYWKEIGKWYSTEMVNRLSKLICTRDFFDFIEIVSSYIWVDKGNQGILHANDKSIRALDETEMKYIKLLKINEKLNEIRLNEHERIEQKIPEHLPLSYSQSDNGHTVP